jgi:hypothetical protein
MAALGSSCCVAFFGLSRLRLLLRVIFVSFQVQYDSHARGGFTPDLLNRRNCPTKPVEMTTYCRERAQPDAAITRPNTAFLARKCWHNGAIHRHPRLKLSSSIKEIRTTLPAAELARHVAVPTSDSRCWVFVRFPIFRIYPTRWIAVPDISRWATIAISFICGGVATSG